ncbi:MAG: hypothetical protein XU12_C0010G0054 [Deltaproteobacteria bacterium CSP1-8]|jgi:hypothetical protein|nr:MAG: hypothetical protein XU12_C0010G0054 [Deltaproteobacteria bacterium CSP1-8]
MSKKRYRQEEIIAKLREADVLISGVGSLSHKPLPRCKGNPEDQTADADGQWFRPPQPGPA